MPKFFNLRVKITTVYCLFVHDKGDLFPMLTFLYYAHSGTRWLVVLATIVALGFMIFSLATSRKQDSATRIIMSTFSSLIGLQWILGLFYYLVYGNAVSSFTIMHQVEHATTMTIVVLAAHMYLPFRKRAKSDRNYYIASIVVILVVLVLVYLGVQVLPQGWTFSQNPPQIGG